MNTYERIWSSLYKFGLPSEPSILEYEVWGKDFRGGKINWNMLGITVSRDW